MRAKRSLACLEYALILVGCTCIGWYGTMQWQTMQYQHEQKAAFEQALEAARHADADRAVESGDRLALPNDAVRADRESELPPPSVEVTPSPIPPKGTDEAAEEGKRAEAFPRKRAPLVSLDPRMIGLLEIPRLRLSTAVLSGDDPKTLDLGPGHLPDTPRPWEPGNSAIAAHRDQHFRPLKNVRVGDEVRVRTTHGDFTYKVRQIKIVTPKDISVLKPTGTDSLTLITCYPFNYIGSAPRRYVVRADRVVEERAATSDTAGEAAVAAATPGTDVPLVEPRIAPRRIPRKRVTPKPVRATPAVSETRVTPPRPPKPRPSTPGTFGRSPSSSGGSTWQRNTTSGGSTTSKPR